MFCGICQAGDLRGKKAPEITVGQWITDSPPNVSDLRGRVTVLDFWAMWCAPCVRSIPHFIELTNKYSKKGVDFVGLSQDKSVDELRKFVKAKKINCPRCGKTSPVTVKK